jgi:magnesium and cobalt transporter
VTVRFVDAEEGRSLNAQYRGKNYATNVLTFAYARQPVLSGDLVLCLPVVLREAAEQGKPRRRPFRPPRRAWYAASAGIRSRDGRRRPHHGTIGTRDPGSARLSRSRIEYGTFPQSAFAARTPLRAADARAGGPRTAHPLLHSAFERNLLDADALSIIEGALAVSDMQVRDVMVPRAQMQAISIDDTTAAMTAKAIETAHSRFPVTGENRDDVIGILLAKDLLRLHAGEDVAVRDMLRPAIFIPDSKRLNVLLREFRASRNHMAIVVDEYGGVAGLVTIEDVLEQIVGDIEDEYDFDEAADNILLDQAGRYRVKATTEIADFNAAFGTISATRIRHRRRHGDPPPRPPAQARRGRADRRPAHPGAARRQPAGAHAAGGPHRKRLHEPLGRRHRRRGLPARRGIGPRLRPLRAVSRSPR